MENFRYKLGDLVWVKSKKKCGVILSWYVDEDDLLMFEVEINGGKIKRIPEYDIDYTGREK